MSEILELQNILDQAKGHLDDCLDTYDKEGIRLST
jgi:hypothetical protein